MFVTATHTQQEAASAVIAREASFVMTSATTHRSSDATRPTGASICEAVSAGSGSYEICKSALGSRLSAGRRSPAGKRPRSPRASGTCCSRRKCARCISARATPQSENSSGCAGSSSACRANSKTGCPPQCRHYRCTCPVASDAEEKQRAHRLDQDSQCRRQPPRCPNSRGTRASARRPFKSDFAQKPTAIIKRSGKRPCSGSRRSHPCCSG